MENLIENRVYRAAVYVRLSKEDGDREESDSIVNQKDLVRDYLKGRPDILICSECVDDGYSGVSFDRPGFRRMMGEISAGKINCVVVKDLSRFGRNFAETGRYLDKIFPAMGVRFIAINDNYDSLGGRTSSDRILIPFKNLLNDSYCRDISVKIRSQLETKRKKGDFIGSFAVYGYIKSPEDRHKLAVDGYAAGVVQEIFKWKLEGASHQRIADRLNGRGELSPMEYKRACGMPYKSGFQVNHKTKWTAAGIGRMLQDETYTGTLVQGRRTTPNHKVKKTVHRPPEEWVRVEGSHPAIIDKEDFLAVRRLLLQDTRVAPAREEVYLFSGLAFCGDCGQGMVRSSVRKNGKTYVYYMCGNNRANRECSSHRISADALEEAVFLSLKRHIADLADVERVLAEIKDAPPHQADVERMDARLAKKQEEAARYEKLKVSLFSSLAEGLVSKEEYLELKAVYEEKLQDARSEEAKIREEIKELLEGQAGDRSWLGQFREYRNLTELTRRAAATLIERVEVFEGRRIEVRFRYQDSYERAVALVKSMGSPCQGDTASGGKEAV